MFRPFPSVLLLAFVALFTVSAAAQTLPADLWRAKTLARIEAFDRTWDGVLGVEAVNLTTGDRLSYHSDVVFPQASVIKVPIMVEVYRQAEEGLLTLDDALPVTEAFLIDPSSPTQKAHREGRALTRTVRELIDAMIVWSDNVATNVLIDRVGMANVNETLKRLGLGFTRLQRVMLDGEAVARNDENVSTPAEMARLMQWIYEGTVVSEAACAEMLSVLERVDDGIREAVPASYRVAAKPGWIPASRSETGVVFLDDRPFVLSVMSAYNGPGDATPVPDVARIVFDHFERLAHSNLYGHRTNVPLE